jgi:hypothetical protein
MGGKQMIQRESINCANIIDKVISLYDEMTYTENYKKDIEFYKNKLLETECKKCKYKCANTVTGLVFNAVIKTSIIKEYRLYIDKYGYPDDGIFIPSLLCEFI